MSGRINTVLLMMMVALLAFLAFRPAPHPAPLVGRFVPLPDWAGGATVILDTTTSQPCMRAGWRLREGFVVSKEGVPSFPTCGEPVPRPN